MAVATRSAPFNPKQLGRELRAAAVLPEAPMVHYSETEYRVTVPDGVNPAPIQAVLDAHVPQPEPVRVDPTVQLLAAIDNATTLAQMRRILKAIVRRTHLIQLANDPDGAL